jgi:hypothetical protein
MPKPSSLRYVLVLLSFFVVILLFGRTREMATSAVSVVYIGGI